jgi:nitrate/TMAO reductase-like tetraheme cytochrome c subunit
MNPLKILTGKGKLTSRHFILLACALVFLFVLTSWSVSYTSQSGFCMTCHEMTPMHKTWQMSAHKNIACIQCHTEPGAMGVVKEKAKGLREVYVHLTGTPATIKADERDISCFSCHQDKVKQNAEKALVMKDPHTVRHFENGMTCVSCHGGLVHDAQKNNMIPSRDTCTACHLDQMKK